MGIFEDLVARVDAVEKVNQTQADQITALQLDVAKLKATPVPTPTPVPAVRYPDSSQFMTEDEEVAWYNSIGFNTTLADLRASYAKFSVQAVNPNQSVMNGEETDNLRNFYALYKRTGYAGFLQQAQAWRDYYVNVYSHPENGGSNVIETHHVYLMGLINWYVDFKDQATLDAINRIIDFILKNLPATFIEQRVVARPIQCLAHYIDKINIRTDVKPALQKIVDMTKASKVIKGFKSVYYYVGAGMSLTGMPAGTDLKVQFPANANIVSAKGLPLIASATTFNLQSFQCASSFQAVMLMHALRLAGRVLGDISLITMAQAEQDAWNGVTGYPWWDKTGVSNNMQIPYNVNCEAADLTMFMGPAGSSTPLYVTQFAAYCPDLAKKKILQQQALLRQWGQYAKILPTELATKPKYYLWQSFENGYFLSQK